MDLTQPSRTSAANDSAPDRFSGRSGIGLDTASAMAARFVGIGATYALAWLITKRSGGGAFGEFSIALGVISIGSITAKLGTDAALMKLHASAVASGSYHDVRAAGRATLRICLIASGLTAAGVWCFAGVIASTALSNSVDATTLRWASLGIPGLALVNLASSGLRGFNLVATFSVAKFALVPVTASLLIALFNESVDATTLYVIALLGALAATVLVLLVPIRRIPPDSRHSKITTRSVLGLSLPLMLVSSGFVIIQWTDTLMLGGYESKGAVGEYEVAFRYASVVAIPLLVVNSITAARYAVLHSQGKMSELQHMAQRTATMMALLTLPIATALVLAPRWFLGLFGDEFKSADTVLLVLTAAQVIGVLGGSVASILAMTGHERSLDKVIVGAVVGNIILNAVFIPRWGIVGAAWTQVITAVIWNGACLGLVWRRLRFFAGFAPMSLLSRRTTDG